MTNNSKDPGSASPEELAKYLRLPSARTAREPARKVGVRHVGGRYAWSSVWAAGGCCPTATLALERTEAAALHG